MPKWLKFILEATFLLLKKKGYIDPNLNKKSEPFDANKTRTPEDVRRNSVHPDTKS